ncbi:hypothetical protein SVIOM342S_02854 [Streptomyces violaceorubidus]
MHPDETVGQAIDVLREYGVSQMPIVKPGAGHPDVMAAEVVGSVVERELLDALFAKRASLEDPLEKHMSAPLPQVGSGEPVADLMSVLAAPTPGDRPRRGQADRRGEPAGRRPSSPGQVGRAWTGGRGPVIFVDFAEVVRARHVRAAVA